MNTPSLIPGDDLAAAGLLHDYLSARRPLPEWMDADAVVGFGHFDLRIPRRCADLRAAGRARLIVFTGGLGAGTADLGMPEADAFAAELVRSRPGVARVEIIRENQSTNTGENIRFTSDLLLRRHPGKAFGRGIHSAVLVATPARMRRVWLTFRAIVPEVEAWCMPPDSDFGQDDVLYRAKGQDLLATMMGELDRLATYPARGWIVREAIPLPVLAAAERLGWTPPAEHELAADQVSAR